MAKAGENVGVLVRSVKHISVRRGMLLCPTGFQTISNHYEAQMYLLSTSEGGRTKPLQVIEILNLHLNETKKNVSVQL